MIRAKGGRSSRLVKTIALATVLAVGSAACSSGPRVRTDERLPDRVGESTVSSDMPGEREFGVVMLVALGLAAAAGLAYLNYELWTD